MKAVVLREFGGPEVLRLEDVDTPAPRQGEVLLKILAAGLNRLDHYIREGSVLPELRWPHVLGSDASAVVEALGPGATRLRVGDRVIPMPGYPLAPEDVAHDPMSAAKSYAIRGIAEWGTYAQYMTIPEHWAVKDETGLAPAEAATLPMAVVTGVRAVRRVGQVKEGQLVLVHAGASGTGSMNIQVAKALGARVASTVRSRDKADFVRAAGAEEVFVMDGDGDFVQAALDWSGGGVDVVIDNLGGDVLGKSLDALRPQGVLVAMGFVKGLDVGFNVRPFFFAQKQIRGSLMGDVADLEWGLQQIADGAISPKLDKVFPLAEAAQAHARLAEGRALGGIVLLAD